ncbi:type II toxin-antitoxin system RelE/ParE family toxin [Sphingopyxis sp. P1IMeth2]|uniref:type II toxin-antitoxin system RelE/ParE family toxin n=1 Tax=Sphingopyxis sp. P1IMeth2 TaxID=1892848 RepID=UPI0021B2C3B1|nr:type II toxin-antitoxin system RelE/ParE family toxin [Sphingopyxis sp. P1IMeth2]
MGYPIVFTPEARDHLDSIYVYIADNAFPAIAQRFTDGILEHIDKLTDYPRRGTMRDDLRQGLRTTAWRRRVTIRTRGRRNRGGHRGNFLRWPRFRDPLERELLRSPEPCLAAKPIGPLSWSGSDF